LYKFGWVSIPLTLSLSKGEASWFDKLTTSGVQYYAFTQISIRKTGRRHESDKSKYGKYIIKEPALMIKDTHEAELQENR